MTLAYLGFELVKLTVSFIPHLLELSYKSLNRQEVSLAQLAMGVDVQPKHPGSNPHGCEFGFLLFIYFKTRCGGLPHRFPFKKSLNRLFSPSRCHPCTFKGLP
jgi:hypothetical protein